MDISILKNEERRMNLIMFLFLLIIPIVAMTYVLLFNGGSKRDTKVLIMVGLDIVVKLFEKLLNKYAKYCYLAILPIVGVLVIVLGTPAGYGAMDEAENFITEHNRMKNICGAYFDENYRGKGVAQGLLGFIIDMLKAESVTHLGVDCEILNPTALNFWSKYFEPYTYSFARRIDERVEF